MSDLFWSNYLLWLLWAALLFYLGTSFFCKQHRHYEFPTLSIIFFLLAISFGVGGVFYCKKKCDDFKTEYANVKHVYLDGREVEKDKIYIFDYHYTIEDDVCYLTER